ncbi:erythromycin esterase family protein [Anaerosacchariphilus polymeriproducens]|nr:erythromycin esterase family protein [Anaerosacchariphilus polymeriproducens]
MKTKHFKIRYIVLSLLGAILLAAFIFMHFGGFSTGKNANPEEFAKYAQSVEDITIPENTRIIALGEATHGNVEFQQLKLDVFKQMVNKYNMRAFALEGDFGGCEQVNRYIHGGKGTAQAAAAAIGFAIYRTDEMAKLISYMRQYNDNAAEGDDLRFYGFDMQRYAHSFHFLLKFCKELGVDTKNLKKLMDGEEWSSEYDNSARMEIITQVKTELEGKKNAAQAVHFADMLLQYCELQVGTNSSTLRDKLMAENVEWILQQEQQLGYERIFVSGHNSHVAKWGSFDSMGKLLSNKTDNGYYVIGTDFYKTNCNLPSSSLGKRTNQIFYSHSPLAKTAKMAGLEICWLNFRDIPHDSELAELILQYTYMGTLGERYSWLMRLIPPSYRMFQPPAVLYDSMIFVTNANPIHIITE